MSYSIKTIPKFDKNLKKLIRKYPSLKNEFISCIQVLKLNPKLGIPLGNNCFKIRIAIKSKNKGKSGGARLITCFVISQSTIYLLSIFDKSERANISDHELTALLQQINT